MSGEGLARREAALDRFDRGAPVRLEELVGRWRGSGSPTGHPFDGLLEDHGWYGKEFLSPEAVHPLLFRDRAGVPRPVDPGRAPFRLVQRAPQLGRMVGSRQAFAAVRPLLWTRRPAARLRLLEHRGTVTAALIYDALPIIDVLRRVDQDTLLGLMDMRGVGRPLFFLLHRDDPSAGPAPPAGAEERRVGRPARIESLGPGTGHATSRGCVRSEPLGRREGMALVKRVRMAGIGVA